jgi:cytochrome c oxidase subunit 3
VDASEDGVGLGATVGYGEGAAESMPEVALLGATTPSGRTYQLGGAVHEGMFNVLLDETLASFLDIDLQLEGEYGELLGSGFAALDGGNEMPEETNGYCLGLQVGEARVIRMVEGTGQPLARAYLPDLRVRVDTILGGVNTCVLILSSLTMAVGVRAAQTNKKGLLSICLALTLAGAIGFLVIKYFEYTHKFHENLKWGQAFYEPVNAADAAAVKVEQKPIENPVLAIASPNPSAGAVPVAMTALPPVDKSAILAPSAGPDGVATTAMVVASTEPAHIHHSGEAHLLDPALPPNTHRFFAIYYIMTGLHGIHVVIGVGVIGWLLIGSLRGRYNSDYYAPVDFVGLYWHVVDLVWIFLFPLFYLIH